MAHLEEQLKDPQYWELKFSQELQRPPLGPLGGLTPIPQLFIEVGSYNLLVGIHNPEAPPEWFLAARCWAELPISPSVTSSFPVGLDHQQVPLKLGRLNLLRFPDLGLSTYKLAIKFPKWHRILKVEVWQFTGSAGGSDSDVLQELRQDLADIEAKINSLL